MLVKKILMIMTALFLFSGCAAKSAKTSATSVEKTKTEEKQNFSISENTDQKQTEQVSKNKKQASNFPSEKESAKADTEKAVSKTDKKSKSKNTGSSEKKVSSSPVISEDASDSHIHDWVHHEATGHYETKTITDEAAWTETIVDQAAWDETPFLGVKCYGCRQIFPDSEACFNHECNHSASPYEGDENVYGPTVHHPAVTHDVYHPAKTHQENVWIQDSAVYDECSICGAKK